MPTPTEAAGRPANAMSVDVEDYYQVSAFATTVARDSWPRYPARVEANTQRVLDLFAEAGVRATFFVLGCVAQRHPGLIRAIVAGGHELASHGLAHYRVFEQSPAVFREDVATTRKVLEDVGGVPVKGYRAASFSINRETWWAFDALRDAGYRYSSSVHPIRHDHYGVPDAPRFPFRPDDGGFVEIPVATVETLGRRWSCAGGGFFRLLPYKWSAHCLRRLNGREGKPGTFYFHPWEIDPGQPRIGRLPLKSRLRHYTNLGVMEAKLRRLLRDFAWSRVDSVYADELDPAGGRARPAAWP